MAIPLDTHILVVEIDENNHSNYSTEDEEKRIIELTEDAGDKPLVLVRFNPD